MTIRVEKFNEVFLRVFAEPGTEMGISDAFTFEVPGARFQPAYKSGMWDGRIRLFDMRRKTLYCGLLKHLQEHADRDGEELEYVGFPDDDVPVVTKPFVDSLQLAARGELMEVRDYQYEAISHAIANERCVLLSPTASGKSLIIYSIMRWMLDQGNKVLILVPTTTLVEQMYADFQDYSSVNGWSIADHCQKLYSGFPREFKLDVMISTWQSVYKQDAAWFNQFDCVFGDEAHTFKAKSLVTILEHMTRVKYRIGTTGTLDNTKVNKLVLEGLFGPVHRVTTTRELMDTNRVADLKIKCLVMKYDPETRKYMKGKSYQDEMEFLVGHDARNKFIRNLALSCEGNTLVLFNYVEKHGKPLYEAIRDKAGASRAVHFVYGGTKVAAREETRTSIEGETNGIIVASYGVFQQGINMPSIENVIFASPTKSKIRNLQSIGRGLRLSPGKSYCKLFDVADDLTWKAKKNHTYRHLMERIHIYAEEQFDFKIQEFEIE